MEEEEKKHRRETTLRAALLLLEAHAAFHSGTWPSKERVFKAPQSSAGDKATAQQRPQTFGDQVPHLGPPLVSGPHLPRMRLSGERLEIAEPIQVSVSPLIPGQWWGVGQETPVVSMHEDLPASFSSSRRAT